MFRGKKITLFSQAQEVSANNSQNKLPKTVSRSKNSPPTRVNKKTLSLSTIYKKSSLVMNLNSSLNGLILENIVKSKLDSGQNIFTKGVQNTAGKKRNSKVLLNKDLPFYSKKDLLEQKMSQIREKYDKYGLSQKTFKMYEEVFSEVIGVNKEIGGILSEIKGKYDEWVTHHGVSKEFMKVKKENTLLKQEIKQKSEENEKLAKNIQFFCSENINIGKKVEESNLELKNIQERLGKITKFNIDDFTIDQNSWKALILENKENSVLCKKLKLSVEEFKLKQEMYMNTFYKMKNSGIDVDVFLKTDKKKDDLLVWEYIDNSLEFEYLTCDMKMNRNKPKKIPFLNIEKIDRQNSNSY